MLDFKKIHSGEIIFLLGKPFRVTEIDDEGVVTVPLNKVRELYYRFLRWIINF